MNVDQTLKDKNTPLIDFPIYEEIPFKKQKNKFFSNLISFYFCLIKQLPYPRTKRLNSNALIINNTKILHVEICSKKIYELLVQGQICASDIRCLDSNSKQCLKKLCLKTCLYKTSIPNSTCQKPVNDTLTDSQHLKIL